MDQREAVVWILFFKATNKDGLTKLSANAFNQPIKSVKEKGGGVKYSHGRPQIRLHNELNKTVNIVKYNASQLGHEVPAIGVEIFRQ